MPYESLTCPKCGSGDCQEVKAGTHFCNHCDNVFKYVHPMATSGGVAACATCGVVAVGLCLTCERYFCQGHQAVEFRTRYTDLCASCLTERHKKHQAELTQQLAEAEARSRRCGRIYLEESARSELIAARVPLVKLYRVAPRVVKGRFGGERKIEDYNWGQVGTGWLLGDFAWEAKSGLTKQTVFFAECTGLPLLHFTPRDFAANNRRDAQSVIFGRIRGTADGGYGIPIDPGELYASYEDLGMVIQRLAGTTGQHR